MWSALALVAAAGGLATLFIGLGIWLERRRTTPAVSGLGVGSGGGLGDVAFPAPPPSLPSSAVHGPAITQAVVGSSPVIILHRMAARGYRRVTVSSNQDVRVGDGSISSTVGFFIPANVPTRLPFKLPTTSSLHAVRAGAADAIVSLMWQLDGG